MRQIEDFMNRLTDMDWGWWPVVALRPAKDKDIDNLVLFKISPVFGSVGGLLLLFFRVFHRREALTVMGIMLYLLIGCVAFFIVYKFTSAYFWNRRARRMRSNKTQSEPVT